MFYCFISILFLSGYLSIAHGNHDIKIKYLENLVNDEVEKASKYKLRNNNEDLVGKVGDQTEVQDFGKFDFIIVGGGTSGSVVANRLSEIEKWKVLLLEAGDLDDDFTDIPYVFNAAGLSNRNWGYVTVPQKYGCFGRIDNQCPYIRGKVLGGSGSVNGLVYSRGIKVDYDNWVAAGNQGWSWDSVFSYFKKIENFQSENIDLKYRGFNGPLNVAYAKPRHILQEAFIKANEELGTAYIEDYNAEKVKGVSLIQHNIQNGKRCSGSNNYVRRAWNRFNFNLTLKAFVTKLLINKDTKTVYGVEFIKEGKKYQATASKEVILSGGAANSPQLLMLSGIGPKNDLEQLGIKVIQDSPVGKFMKDHIGFLALYFKSNYVEQPLSTKNLVTEYLNGEGLYTIPSNYRSIAYYNTRNNSSPNPNLEIAFAPPQGIDINFPVFTNYKKELNNFMDKVNLTTDWNFHLYLLHPKSSGTLRLKSADPKEFPLLDSKIFENEEDLEDLYRGILIGLKIAETSVGKSFNLTLNLKIPSCSNEKYLSKQFWYCALRQIAFPAYHLSSTARMGPPNDTLAVVDPELKVYGIKNLRVIDTSIVPRTVTGHMNAQAFLIGEKGADLIKNDHLIHVYPGK